MYFVLMLGIGLRGGYVRCSCVGARRQKYISIDCQRDRQLTRARRMLSRGEFISHRGFLSARMRVYRRAGQVSLRLPELTVTFVIL
jgi:hypothetical protein